MNEVYKIDANGKETFVKEYNSPAVAKTQAAKLQAKDTENTYVQGSQKTRAKYGYQLHGTNGLEDQ